jgi:uncharacterized membrane protein
VISFEALVFIVPAIISGAFGSIYLKKGAKAFTLNLRRFRQNYTAILGLSLFGLSMLFYLFALGHGELSILYSLSSFIYVIIAFLSQMMLDEKMNTTKWIGIFLIITGSIFIVW